MFATRNHRHLTKISKNLTMCTRHLRVINSVWGKFENPLLRTLRILRDDLKAAKASITEPSRTLENMFPKQVDIAVIGGGAMGSSIAYWLKEKTGQGLSVAVIEKDQTYSQSSTVLSVGGLRQQFSLPENIQMSMFGAEFIRNLKTRFGPDADVYFTPNGYLMLASEEGAAQLIDNSKLQKELGAVNIVLSKNQLKERFPWMDVTDVEVGCLGLEKEGWFDPWALLCLLRRGAVRLGAQYVNGEVVKFNFTNKHDFIIDGVEQEYESTNELVVKGPDGELQTMSFAYAIIAAGPYSGQVAELANIGTGSGMLSVGLPVEKRKRYVYCFECQGNGPSLNTPLTIDFSGAYFRRDGLGGSYIAGMSPMPEDEPPTDNLDVDHEYFDERVWPILAKRVPAFNSIKVRSAWGGFYEYNTFDENGIVGPHPLHHNLYIATGFSGHGIQQSPAVGRAVAEMILDGGFQTIDLTRFGFNRLLLDKPMYEVCIV